MFFDVSFDGNEILRDEIGGALVLVRFGVQPSTCASTRRRTEIQQDGPVLLFGGEQRLIDVPTPVYRHVVSSSL